MSKRAWFKTQRFKRSAIKKDLIFFAPPAIIVFFFGLLLSFTAGYEGFFPILWKLISQPQNLFRLSAKQITGFGLILGGFSVIIIAHLTIGLYYSSTLVKRENHELITHGIYRYVRHPIYSGVLMVCFGIPVYAGSLYSFLIMAGMIPIFLIRIRLEERLLNEEFGDVYLDYRLKTKKLILFIY